MQLKMKFVILSFFLLKFTILLAGPPDLNHLEIKKILSLNVTSSINPATFNYISEGFNKADKENYGALLLKLNTPGGLVTTTKQILSMIGESDIPTIVWVTPEGASATSAGAIIASGAHFLFMSEGTNIGAATPIQLGKDIEGDDLKAKAINDLVALVQSLAETRGRNSKLFGEMVAKAKSFKSHEAKEQKLIDGIANNLENILQLINNKKIRIKGVETIIRSTNSKIDLFEMDLGQKILNIFASPNMAYILFIIGAALIYLELQAAGGFIAGSVGAVALILAGIGFQVLPLNIGALGLMILSFVLFVLEAYITSYGILSLAGLAALTFGSLFLFRTDNAYIELSSSIIISTVSGVAVFIFFITTYLVRDMLGTKHVDHYSLNGLDGQIISILDSDQEYFLYQIKIPGEIWKAKSKTEYKISDKCIILKHDKNSITLEI